jgi:predicted ArsR family transcriptional regulator
MNVSLQQTRSFILDILREKGEATVDEIVTHLQQKRGKDITPVTVRHHLHLLETENLISSPLLRRKSSPGRPQHVYALTEKAKDLFPTNYERLATQMLSQLATQYGQTGVNVILEGVAEHFATEINLEGMTLQERLAFAVEHLNKHGYDAYIETSPDGFVLHTRNCPYHHLAQATDALCEMDMRFVSSLVGIVPRRVSRMNEGAVSCSYLLPATVRDVAQ